MNRNDKNIDEEFIEENDIYEPTGRDFGYDPYERETKILKLIAFGIALLAIVVLVSLSTFTVKQGTVAIITKFGKVVDIKEPGLHFKIPFVEKKKVMEVRERTVKFGEGEEFKSIKVSTKDMQTIDLELTVSNVTTDPLKLYKAFTGRHLESLMLPRIKDAVQGNISKYTIEQFISQRPQLALDIFNDIKSDLEPYGILVTNVSITNHDFSDAYEEAVEQKKVAEQAVETEKALQKKKMVEQESRVKLAELSIKERKLEAEANKIETQSITKELLSKWWIEKWDGELPKVSGDSQGIILSDDIISK